MMRDVASEVIYVGKAINLKSRVRSYFTGNDNRSQIPFLLERVVSVDTLVCEDERQAIVLENDLIKKYKPRYNVRLKDDKAHYIIRIDRNSQWPRLELVRKTADDGAQYIGPFAYGYEVRALMDVINRSIPLRTCSDKVLHNRVRPCLEYQIKRCAGPCCFEIDKNVYDDWVEQAVKILKGKNPAVVKQLEEEILAASQQLRFEDAAVIRDRLNVLKKAMQESLTQDFSFKAHDAFGFYREDNVAVLSVLMVRHGRLFEAKNFSFHDLELPDEEIFGSLLTQYYERQESFPDEIVLPFQSEDAQSRAELISERAGRKVTLSFAQRGPKARLLTLALDNARENFDGLLARRKEKEQTLYELYTALGLEDLPRTIDCADISHFQGGETVASVVRFKDGKPDKAHYRRFVLESIDKPDDFASMREVLLRHLSRGNEEHTLADLLVIDGGPGQLSQGSAVIRELGLQRPQLIGLAKKRVLQIADYRSVELRTVVAKPERIYLENQETPVVLAADSKCMHLLEQLRNEAHRFAITFHRQRRSKRIFSSRLEEIPGIGDTRRKELLRVFRSVEGIRNATPEQLQQQCGLPITLARRVIEILNIEEKQ